MKEELAEALCCPLSVSGNRSLLPPLRLKDERPAALQRKLEKVKRSQSPRALLPHLSRITTHISKLVVPEVRLVTLEQLYCKVTVLSIAFLQERAQVCNAVRLAQTLTQEGTTRPDAA